MEVSTPQPEFSGHPRPDFYEHILEYLLTEADQASNYKIFIIDDVENAISMILEHLPEAEIIDKNVESYQGEKATFIRVSSGRMVILIVNSK